MYPFAELQRTLAKAEKRFEKQQEINKAVNLEVRKSGIKLTGVQVLLKEKQHVHDPTSFYKVSSIYETDPAGYFSFQVHPCPGLNQTI